MAILGLNTEAVKSSRNHEFYEGSDAGQMMGGLTSVFVKITIFRLVLLRLFSGLWRAEGNVFLM